MTGPRRARTRTGHCDPRAVEFFAVHEPSGVMHGHGVAIFSGEPSAGGEFLDLQFRFCHAGVSSFTGRGVNNRVWCRQGVAGEVAWCGLAGVIGRGVRRLVLFWSQV